MIRYQLSSNGVFVRSSKSYTTQKLAQGLETSYRRMFWGSPRPKVVLVNFVQHYNQGA